MSRPGEVVLLLSSISLHIDYQDSAVTFYKNLVVFVLALLRVVWTYDPWDKYHYYGGYDCNYTRTGLLSQADDQLMSSNWCQVL